MSPGMLTSRHQGGFGFRHSGNYARWFSAPNAAQAYRPRPGGRRERFYIDDEGRGALEAGDTLKITVDGNGDTIVVLVGSDNENANGEVVAEEESKRRGLFGQRDKMAVSSNSDGTTRGHAVTQPFRGPERARRRWSGRCHRSPSRRFPPPRQHTK